MFYSVPYSIQLTKSELQESLVLMTQYNGGQSSNLSDGGTFQGGCSAGTDEGDIWFFDVTSIGSGNTSDAQVLIEVTSNVDIQLQIFDEAFNLLSCVDNIQGGGTESFSFLPSAVQSYEIDIVDLSATGSDTYQVAVTSQTTQAENLHADAFRWCISGWSDFCA